jgi:hypothetical protein
MTEAISLKPTLIPNGVADAAGHLGCIEVRGRRIECLDLTTGERIGEIQLVGIPLLIQNQQLIAWSAQSRQPNVLQLYTISLQTGMQQPQLLQEVTLPSWCDATRSNPLDFKLEAAIQNQQLVLRWQCRSRYRGGAAPSQELVNQFNRDAIGTVYVSLDTGRIISTDIQESTPEVDTASRNQVLSLPTISYRQAASWHNQPWVIDRQEFLLLQKTEQGQQGFYLSKRDLDSNQPASLLKLLEDVPVDVTLTLDGRHILAYLPDPSTRASINRDWHIFSVPSGYQVGTITYESHSGSVNVVDSQLFYIVDQSTNRQDGEYRRRLLKACDLASGAIQWSFLISEGKDSSPPPLPR